MEVLPSQVILRNSTVGNVESSTSCDRPWMERHTSKMIYRPNDTNGCSIKCDYSVLFDPSSVSIFHSNMALAAKLLISFSSASLIIYILTFGSNIRRQLRECSCALSFTFLLLGERSAVGKSKLLGTFRIIPIFYIKFGFFSKKRD